jgi:hypothetical protein
MHNTIAGKVAVVLNLNRWLLTDEAKFHISGKMNTHKVIIWGTGSPHFT